MNKVELLCNNYLKCPICSSKFESDDLFGFNAPIPIQTLCKRFVCHNLKTTNPFHYYSHIIDKLNPKYIIYQEFSLNLGPKIILFANDFISQKTLIRSGKDAVLLSLDFIIVPDFPHLTSLKSKVRTSMVFS